MYHSVRSGPTGRFSDGVLVGWHSHGPQGVQGRRDRTVRREDAVEALVVGEDAVLQRSSSRERDDSDRSGALWCGVVSHDQEQHVAG